ncbi:hypothetical protein [Microbacterium thalli]|uniref:hypothetical protein n=1 Tax=Microbacterium thalli TaxID=3027921 RepID=UPI0023672C75|nr:hypothetical protein [Microbacterium thalli]MDD7929266.1 hypothetical protein [Microbacterium thalli]
MADATSPPAPSPRVPRSLWWIAGAMIASGLLLILFDALITKPQASFGWFAYQPLAAASYFPTPGTVVSPLMWAGIAVAVVGLLALAFLLGRRSATPPPAQNRPTSD